MNEYEGKVCPYCKTKFQEGDDIVVCSSCDMPHHKECWIDNQGCTTFGCLGTIKSPDGSQSTVTSSTVSYEDTHSAQDMMYCSQCGAQNKASSSFCFKCGASLHAAGHGGAPHFTPAADNSNSYGYNYQNNQYQQNQGNAFTRFSNADANAFVGTNANYYIPKFNQLNAQNKKSSWNWCAFLFAPYWFVYRKMYGYGAAVFAGIFVLTLFDSLVIATLSLAIYIVFGILGNYIYMQQINKHISRYNALSGPMKSQYLSQNSGTNTGATVLAAIGYAILVIIFRAI